MAGSYHYLRKRTKGGSDPLDNSHEIGGSIHHQTEDVFGDVDHLEISNQGTLEQSHHDHRTTRPGHCLTSSSSGQKRISRHISVRDFTCACCSDLMISPTTLNCGHSFCRLCIAQWWSTSETCTCPLCRQEWTGFPQVNFILRSTIEKACTERYQERSLILQENADILEKFEEFGRKQKDAKPNRSNRDFWCGTVLTLVLIYVLYMLWNWRSSDQDLLTYKPIAKWTPSDVSSWVSSLGDWAQGQYSNAFFENSINGKLLLSISDDDLERSPFNIKNGLHRRAIVHSLFIVATAEKKPTDMWEYKALHQGLSLFLVYGMKDYPRVTLAYLYWYHHKDVFVPFVRTTCPGPKIVLHNDKESSFGHLIEFTIIAVIMPYYLTACFAWEWILINTWTSLCVIINSILIMLIEFKRLRRFIASGGQGFWIGFCKKYTSGLLVLGISSLVYTILPAVLCDFFFYLGLYLSPLLNFYDLYVSQHHQ